MNKRTLKALEDSIEKWRQVAAGEMADMGGSNCMLCQEFVVKKDSCVGCPVYKATNEEACCFTPYEDWLFYQPWEGGEEVFVADTPEKRKMARAEWRFLKSLLP